jgi:ABC-2 type transport system permease protein
VSATAARVAPPAAPAARDAALAGTLTLIRFILRRDRVRLSVWVGSIASFVVVFAGSLPGLYADAAERQIRAELMANPGVRAMSGPGFGLDDYTFGAMLAQEFLSWTAIFVALMSFLLVVRHTRAEEESGRAELVRAGVVGRHTSITAALVAVIGANVVLGVLIAVGLGSLGIESVTWPSSWLFGAALASVGVVFAAVAAVTAQLSTSARGAGGLAGLAFAVAFLLRAAGDMGDGPWSWLSPIGWAQQTRVYVDDRWWPLGLSMALTVALAGLAYALSTRRDVGGGMLRQRPGSAEGSRLLSTPLGLAVRLHRASVLWWGGALFLFGLGYGALAGEVERFVEEVGAVEEWIAQAGGDSIIDGFLSVVISLWAIAVAIFALLTMFRLRTEETGGRAEPILATAVSRTGWVASHLTVALVGSAILMLLSGLGLGLTASAALDDASVLPRLIGASLAYLPAIWVVVGVGVALFGLVPRATVLAWIVVAYAALIGMFYGFLGLPDWTFDLSPFGHVPALPAAEMSWPPLLVLSAITAVLTVLGLVGFRRRDLDMK